MHVLDLRKRDIEPPKVPNRKPYKTAAVVFSLALLTLIILNTVLAWTNPTTAPGTGGGTINVDANGALTLNASGINQNVTITPSGSGYTVLNGSVGIGTAIPTADLHIVGGATTDLVISTGQGSDYKQTFRNIQGTGLNWLWGDNTNESLYLSLSLAGGQNRFDNKSRDFLFRSTAINPIMLLQNNTGNIGIGTATPNTILDVNGAVSVRSMIAPAVSPAGQGRIYFDSTANKFKVSENSGTYADLVGTSGGGSKFGGDGSDLTCCTTGVTTTLDLGGAAVFVKNYNSISITGATRLAFTTPNANGTLIVLKSQGNVTISCTVAPCIDASGMGAIGGASRAITVGGRGGGAIIIETGGNWNFTTPNGISVAGLNGQDLTYASNATGQAGSGTDGNFYNPSYKANGGVGALSGSGGAGGAARSNDPLDANLYWNHMIPINLGAGGGGGASTGNGIGGTGGGSGGFFLALYNGSAAGAGTINVAGGAGGAGFPWNASCPCGGGGGGGGNATAGAAGQNDAPGVGGGGGGSGGNGDFLIVQNKWF